MDYEDAIANSIVAGVKRIKPYKKVIKALYAQFFHQMMANIDAVCLRVISHMGYQEDDYTKKQFDTYIQGRQGENAKSFRQYQGYFIYDRANLVWNFLKHNSFTIITLKPAPCQNNLTKPLTAVAKKAHFAKKYVIFSI